MVDLNGTLIAQIINFLILAAIMTKLAYKPLVQILADRQAVIAERLAATEQEKIQAEQFKFEYEKQLAAAHTQAQIMIEEATKLGEQARDQMLAEARAVNDRTLQAALEEIARERTCAMNKLRQEVVNLSILAATKIIDQKLDQEVNTRLAAEMIDSLDELKPGGLPC